MAFFCYETSNPPTTLVDVVYQGTSIMFGNIVESFRKKVCAGIRALYPAVNWGFWDTSQNSTACWNALAKVTPLIQGIDRTPILIPIDWSNDRDDDSILNNSREGWIRRIWSTWPECNLVVILWPVVNIDGTITEANSDHAEYKALCDYYGIPYVDVHTEIYTRVMVDAELITTYYNYPTDRVHPLEPGHQAAFDLLQPTLAALLYGARQFGAGGSLPARYYAGSAEYENAPTVWKLGSEYDSITGTWTESGGVMTSSSAGSTITYSGNFCSIGIEDTTNVYAQVERSLDGGAFSNMTPSRNGIYMGAYGPHTVTFKVKTAMRIDKFFAV